MFFILLLYIDIDIVSIFFFQIDILIDRQFF